jgi:DNA-binding NarL/FixJ family response regulator
MNRLSQLVNGDAGNSANGGPRLSDVVLIDEIRWPQIQKWYSMTERELQIAKSVCHGLSNQQIADSLKIQQGTVKTHMRNIYRKTWVNNKIAMLLRFVEAANSMSPQSLNGTAQAKKES